MKYTNKNLTVMFTDICGFTKQTGKTSRSDMMQRLAKHNALLLPVIKAWGGTLIKSIGDAFLLTFESPTDALHCALCLQHTLREYNQTAKETQKIHLKISVNSGEITLTDDDVFGDPVNVAAKIEKATQPGETLFTEAVFLSMNQSEVPCEPAGSFAAKGDNAPVTELYRLVMKESTPSYQSILSEFRARTPQITQNSSEPGFISRHIKKLAGLTIAGTFATGVAFTLLYTQKETAAPSVQAESTVQADVSISDQVEVSLAVAKPAVEKAVDTTALASNIYREAKDKSFADAGKLLETYKTQYTQIKNWENLEREQHLGGLHNLTRDQWRSQWNNRWFEHIQALYQYAENDADFSMRVALEISSINRKHNKIAAPQEQDLVSKAIKMKPELLTSERNNLINLAQSWLKIEQENGSFARELAGKHLYKELRPWLIAGLRAENTYRSPPEADFPWRQNCLAILADQNDLDAVGSVPAYFKDNIPVFMRATETLKWGDGTVKNQVFLSEEQMRRVLQLPMNDKEKATMIELVDQLLADTQANAQQVPPALKAMLLTR